MNLFKLVLCFSFLVISCKDINKIFGVGSYPYVEKYSINNSEDEVIGQIKTIKKGNDLLVPKFQWSNEEIELDDKRQSHWYGFYIYLKDRNQILYFWTRSGEYTNSTTLALVAVRDGLGLGNWKTINKDLSEKENKEIKKIFEEQIISKIH